MQNLAKIIVISSLSIMLSACGAFFDKDNLEPPAPLVNFKPEAKVNSVWERNAGSGVANEYLKIHPAIANQKIFLADKEGNVSAYDVTTGKKFWSISTQLPISAGIATSEQAIFLASRDGDVVAIDQTNGKILWHSNLTETILAKPTVAKDKVLIKSVDGQLNALDITNGHTVWNFQQVEPDLILRGSSSPQVVGDNVIVGFANGRIVKLALNDGSLIWQQTIAYPSGGFKIQRMVDIDADPIILDGKIYAATYQGQIAAVNLSNGNIIWKHDLSSYTGLASDGKNVYATDAESHVWAFDAETGNSIWLQKQLHARNITGPALVGNNIVVGDAEGYLHWLNKQDGHFVARVKVNDSGILAAPITFDDMVYVATINGDLAAYKI